MWDAKTKQLVADGKLVVLGVVQEQHADRAQLYKQWKQYEFPIAQDSITGLGLAVVPVPILIDEHGIVMSTRPKVSQIDALVAKKTTAPKTAAPVLDPEQTTSKWLIENASGKKHAEIAIGDALLREGTLKSVLKSVKHYKAAASKATAQKAKSSQARISFRLGVAHRTLFDLTKGKQQDPEQFLMATKFWSEALEQNPNQYIWRRRIQQYGPRQIKPYPFYDWVAQAQKDIAGRGEKPVALVAALTESEIAKPGRTFTAAAAAKNPDPEGSINRDQDGMVSAYVNVVPRRVKPGKTVRVHVQLKPESGHWNNEASELVLWVNDSEHGKASKSLLSVPNAEEASSSETRVLEFEFQTNKNAKEDFEISAYSLYYICTDDNGQCFYKRQDIPIKIDLDTN